MSNREKGKNRGEIGEGLAKIRCLNGYHLNTARGAYKTPVAMKMHDGYKGSLRLYTPNSDRGKLTIQNLDKAEPNFEIPLEIMVNASKEWSRLVSKISVGKEKDVLKKLEYLVKEIFYDKLKGGRIKVGGKNPDTSIEFEPKGSFLSHNIKVHGLGTSNPALVNSSIPKSICFGVKCIDPYSVMDLANSKEPLKGYGLCPKYLKWTGYAEYTRQIVSDNLARLGLRDWLPNFFWFQMKYCKERTVLGSLKLFAEYQGWDEKEFTLQCTHLQNALVHIHQGYRLLEDWTDLEYNQVDGGIIIADLKKPSVKLYEAMDQRNYGQMHLNIALFDGCSYSRHESGVYLPQGYFRASEVGVGHGKTKDAKITRIKRTVDMLNKAPLVNLPYKSNKEITLERCVNLDIKSPYRFVFRIIDPEANFDLSQGRFFQSIWFRENLKIISEISNCDDISMST